MKKLLLNATAIAFVFADGINQAFAATSISQGASNIQVVGQTVFIAAFGTLCCWKGYHAYKAGDHHGIGNAIGGGIIGAAIGLGGPTLLNAWGGTF